MKSNIKSLKSLSTINHTKKINRSNLLNEIDLILYSTNLCLFSTRVIRDEIKVKDYRTTLNMLNNEILKLHNILLKKDFIYHSSYTKKDTKEFFKKVGIKPRHLK